MVEGELTIAPLDTGATALKYISTVDGHLLQQTSFFVRAGRYDATRLIQWREQVRGALAHDRALVGLRGFVGDPLQINGRDQGLIRRRFDLWRQIEYLDLGLNGGKKETDSCQEASRQALGFAELLLTPLGEVGGTRELLERLPTPLEAFSHSFGGLDLTGV